MEGQKYIIKQVGKKVGELIDGKGNGIALYEWFHKHTSNSLQWAITNGGYKIEKG